ncbi:MAG TPA: DUF4097 family beta strand repeat-containing protein [Pyrinomonadaceae bacterium]
MSWLYSIVFAGLLFGSNSEPAVSTAASNALPSVKTVAAAQDEIEKFEQTYPLSKNGSVRVSNVNGSVIVEAWDRDEVRLEATKIADSRETLADVEIKVNSTADSFSVEADYKGWKWSEKRNENRNRKLEVEFRLSVPRGAVLNEIETVNGSVSVSNFTNVTKVSAVNGNVNANNLRGAASLSTVNGQVNADFDRVEGASKINLSTVNGQVNLTLPSDVNATVKADSLNGNITNDFGLPVRKGQYVGRDLYGRIGTGEAQIKLSSVNGGLSVSRKNDGRSPNPATNLLPNKKADDDWDGDIDKAMNAAQIDREVARAVRESQRATAEGIKEAQKAIESIAPTMERIKIEELKGLEKLKIDEKQLEKKLKEKINPESLTPAMWFPGSPMIEKKRNKFAVTGTPKVNVEATGCAVSVRGWDKPEVQYVVTELAGRRGQTSTVTENHTNSTVTLKVVNNAGSAIPGFQFNPERVRIEVFVPRKSNLRIATDGEIRLDGVSGNIELQGEDESINIRDVDGSLTLNAEQAQVRVIGFKGNLDSHTACGDVYLEGDFKRLSAKATDGTVTLTVPNDANATLTSNTEIETEGVEVIREDERTWKLGRGGSKYDFDFNDGKLVVRSASSMSSQ